MLDKMGCYVKMVKGSQIDLNEGQNGRCKSSK